LEIDEKTLETALQNKLPAIRQLFGNDTNGDLVIDSGFAYSVDALIKPYVDIGGIVALKTGTIDTSISQTQKRIDTLDKQLASKESDLKRQYGMMEGSLNRMEQASGSLDQFSKNSSQ
jgi:flagellar hook-associated protein 2